MWSLLTYSRSRNQAQEEQVHEAASEQSGAGLNKEEIARFTENFRFYDKSKQGFVERFELPMVLKMCSYRISDAQVQQVIDFLDELNPSRIDL